MKRLYALFLLAIPAISFAQIGVHFKNDTIQECYTDLDVELDVEIINLDSTSSGTVFKWRLMNDFNNSATSNWSNYVCEGDVLSGLGQCYPSSTRASNFVAPLAYMDSSSLQSHIMTTLDTGMNTSVLVVFNPQDSANTVVEIRFTAHATLDPAGVATIDIDAVLSQNAPNPFSANTSISYDIQSQGRLKIRDLTGKLVREMNLEAGKGKVSVSNLHAGIYFYSLYQGDQMIATKRMQVVK